MVSPVRISNLVISSNLAIFFISVSPTKKLISNQTKCKIRISKRNALELRFKSEVKMSQRESFFGKYYSTACVLTDTFTSQVSELPFVSNGSNNGDMSGIPLKKRGRSFENKKTWRDRLSEGLEQTSFATDSNSNASTSSVLSSQTVLKADVLRELSNGRSIGKLTKKLEELLSNTAVEAEIGAVVAGTATQKPLIHRQITLDSESSDTESVEAEEIVPLPVAARRKIAKKQISPAEQTPSSKEFCDGEAQTTTEQVSVRRNRRFFGFFSRARRFL